VGTRGVFVEQTLGKANHGWLVLLMMSHGDDGAGTAITECDWRNDLFDRAVCETQG
jgi:hypothetical protein